MEPLCNLVSHEAPIKGEIHPCAKICPTYQTSPVLLRAHINDITHSSWKNLQKATCTTEVQANSGPNEIRCQIPIHYYGSRTFNSASWRAVMKEWISSGIMEAYGLSKMSPRFLLHCF